MKTDIEMLARSFVQTDTSAIREDVIRLGSIEAAAKYASEIAIGQPHWEALDSYAGRDALQNAIRAIL